MIGIDMINVNKIDLDNKVFIKRFFTKKEVEESDNHYDKKVYFAERFAAKEAAFKALNNIITEYDDLRLVETLSNNNIPYIKFTNKLEKYNNVYKLSISISNEDNYVIVIVQANHL